MECKCCCEKMSKKALSTYVEKVTGVHKCDKCGAIQGTCYKGDSYKLVLPYMWDSRDGDEPDIETWVYFDFKVLGSDGIGRRHGWFDPKTRLVMQIG